MPSRAAQGRTKPPRQASVWKPTPRSRASSDSSAIGSITPWGNEGDEPTTTIVSLSMASAVAGTSAR